MVVSSHQSHKETTGKSAGLDHDMSPDLHEKFEEAIIKLIIQKSPSYLHIHDYFFFGGIFHYYY